MTQLPNIHEWLQAGIPLTLLVDLLDPTGPDSVAILTAEPGDSSWIFAA